jgi:hypothetical protein
MYTSRLRAFLYRYHWLSLMLHLSAFANNALLGTQKMKIDRKNRKKSIILLNEWLWMAQVMCKNTPDCLAHP